MLCEATFPKHSMSADPAGAQRSARLSAVIAMVGEIRAIRAMYRLPPNRSVSVVFVPSDDSADIQSLKSVFPVIDRLAKAESRPAEKDSKKIPNAASVFVAPYQLHVLVGDVVDLSEERRRIAQRVEEITGFVQKNEKRMADTEFLKNAPEEVVETMKEKTEAMRKEKDQLVRHLA